MCNRSFSFSSGVILGAVLVSGAWQVSVVDAVQHDQYLSTGDNFYVGSWLPLETPAAIDASFDMLLHVFDTRRIFWRGMQDQLLIESNLRAERAMSQSFLSYYDFIINDRNINQYAIQAAHNRGMEIWGQVSLYDWGASADTGEYGFPAAYEHPLRVDNPEWVPVDKYGYRRQSGPVEFAYGDARQAAINWIDNEVSRGYDGVLFHTYAENFGTRHADEFGFSEPIVQEFKNRYGVDITREAFNKQDWYSLRGEYTTTFLQELNDELGAGKKIGVAIEPLDTNFPQYWLSNPHYPNIGNIELDWQQWAQDGSVDQLIVWGGTGWGPTRLSELKAGTAGTGIELSAMSSSPHIAAWQPYVNQGHVMTMAASYEWQYLLYSDLPPQPKSSLTHTDEYLRMRTLAQIINGDTSATVAEVSPLLSDTNLLNRRMALTALGRIGGEAAAIAIESGLNDPDGSVRNAAVYALAQTNRPQSYNAIINAIEQHGDFIFNEGAFNVFYQQTGWTSQLLDTLATHPNAAVREVTMRSLYYHSISTLQAPTVVAATQDSSAVVRSFAVDVLGWVRGSTTGINTLLDIVASNDPLLSSRAASSLSFTLQYHDPAAINRRGEILGKISDAFETLGDGTTRADADWAWRPIGLALLDVGNDGALILRNYMNQREDRRLSEQAWETLYLTQRTHQSANVTEEQDAYAHYKRPRWDTVVVAGDNFDTKPLGTFLHDQPAPQGRRWTVNAGFNADHVVQSEYNNGGNAIAVTRRAGEHQQLFLTGYDREMEAAELTRVVVRADWMHLNGHDSTSLLLNLGSLSGPSVYIDPAGNYRIWESDGTRDGGQYLYSGYSAGTSAWETIEIVLSLSLSDQNALLHGTYDVYLTREQGGSLPALSRTLIANDVAMFSIAERTLMNLVISNQTHPLAGDITTYWDNVSFTVEGMLPVPVPEPASGLLLLTSVGLMCRRVRGVQRNWSHSNQ